MMIRFEEKMLSVEECERLLSEGVIKRPLVFTNGVIDILHRGHASY